MTLMDLLQLIKRYIKLVVIIPAICALVACVVFLLMPKDYQAVATITASNEVAAVGGIATTAASEASNNSVSVESKANTSTKQITLTAEGHNAQLAIEAANNAAQSAANRAQESFSTQTFTVVAASAAVDISQNPFKLTLVVFLVVLFLVICCIVAWDAIQRPIKGKNDLEEIVQAPVIGQLPLHDHGERLFANVRFIAKNKLNTVCVVPVSDSSASRQVAEVLYGASSALGISTEVFKADPHAEYLYADTALADFNIIDCAPLSQGMGAAYLGRNADVVILAVRQWSDSIKGVELVLDEFAIAGISLDGIVMLPESVLKNKAMKKGIQFKLPTEIRSKQHVRYNE